MSRESDTEVGCLMAVFQLLVALLCSLLKRRVCIFIAKEDCRSCASIETLCPVNNLFSPKHNSPKTSLWDQKMSTRLGSCRIHDFFFWKCWSCECITKYWCRLLCCVFFFFLEERRKGFSVFIGWGFFGVALLVWIYCSLYKDKW